MYSKRFWFNKIGIPANQTEVRRVFQIKDNFLSIVRTEGSLYFPKDISDVSFGLCKINIVKPNIVFYSDPICGFMIEMPQLVDMLKNKNHVEYLSGLTWIYQANSMIDEFTVLNLKKRKRA